MTTEIKQKAPMPDNNIESLVSSILETNQFFKQQTQQQVNVSLTLRNWFIGFYMVEYEQAGTDRAQYGKKLYKVIAKRLETQGLKHLRERHLYLCKDLYLAYPNILLTASAKLYITQIQSLEILPTVSAKFFSKNLNGIKSLESSDQIHSIDPEILINRLSFSHFIELLKADSVLKRTFYELHTIKNNWAVRELQRAMNSMLFERVGLSTDKNLVLEKHLNGSRLEPEDVFRNPYMLEFLGLEEKSEYSETDLEQAIINQLQVFLLELGRGFCFEARQKRITFDNKHYRIDLIFYHRILKCHVIIDLKIGEFSHDDAGQMNVYLNYYKENEMHENDNPPVGIILCASKNENLVKYATSGLPQKVFVSKYLVNLPSEAELRRIIEGEQGKM
jgi:predicted nuclease of restriction endonuclease-like (RecB) superfamily